MLQKKTIYLAGPIHGLSDDACTAWRKAAKRMYGGPTLDPMRRDARGQENNWGVIRDVVEQDKQDIALADGVLVYFTKPSVGTSMEILFAWMLRKPVALVNATPGDAMSIWLNYHCRVFLDLRTAIDYLNETLNPQPKAETP